MRAHQVAAVGRWLCVAGATLGALGLMGWITRTAFLYKLVPGQPPMMPNTALALLLAGTAGALRHRQEPGRGRLALSRLASLVVLAVGLGTFVEYVAQVDVHIDELLAPSRTGRYPGRPSPPTALALALLGMGLLVFDSRPDARLRPSEWFIAGAGVLAFTAILGQIFGSNEQYGAPERPVIGVAVPTALAILFISAGLLFERPAAGVMRVSTSMGPGGVLLRRLLVAIVLAPAVLGVAVAWLLRVLGVDELPLGLAMFGSLLTVVGLVLLIASTESLDRTHQALELARARARDLFEQAVEGVFVADLQGHYTDVNAAGCRMLGYSRDEILGMTIVDLISREDVERLWREKREMIEGGIQVGEWTLRRKDGVLIPVEVSAKILADGRWQAFARDISDRKKAENEIRDAKERFELALKGADLAAWDWNVQTGQVVFSSRWSEMRGFRPDEVRPHVDSWKLGVHPEDWPRVEKALNDHFRGLTPEAESEHRVLTKAGTWIWVLDRGKVFERDAEGQPIRMVGTELDITELKRAENEQKFLAEVGTVFSSSLEYEVTAKNIVNLAVRRVADVCIVAVVDHNGEFQRLEIAARDPSKASACERLMQTPLDRAWQDLLRSVLDANEAVLLRPPSPDPAARNGGNEDALRALHDFDPHSIIGVPLATPRNRLGVMILASSRSSRPYGPADVRLAEEIGRRAALSIENAQLYLAARRAVQDRDDMLGVVAHDLRNPLGTVLIQAARLHRPGLEPERRSRRPVEAIERAATRMNRLIQDLLDVTQVEAGQLSVERTRLPAVRLVTDGSESHRALAASASIELELDLAPDLPDVLGDRDRLLQVFENLVGNALKFTEPGGHITLGAAAGEGEVLFRVSDTGVGISAEDRPHLFDRFWKKTKTGQRGAGLGLAIVKGIVEAHGGRVWVDSAPGRGSTFFFTIPRAAYEDRWRPEPAPHGG